MLAIYMSWTEHMNRNQRECALYQNKPVINHSDGLGARIRSCWRSAIVP